MFRNMQLSIAMAFNASAEIAALDDYGATVRFQYPSGSADSPQKDVGAASWSRISGKSAGESGWGGFSATCWYAGRALWESLGSGVVPIGLIEASVGGTAIRQWSPMEALAACPQPYNSPKPYGTGPYAHSTLYNAQIAPYGTGPTALSAIIWDQAESDSFPQTPHEYYACAGPAQVKAWRRVLQAPTLPFVIEHLQPYVAEDLELLRSGQLATLSLPYTGYASAIDLGDPQSPLGAVHFRNKQAIGARLALTVRSLWGEADAAAVYPPPSFLTQAVYMTNSSSGGNVTYMVVVSFFRESGGSTWSLSLDPSPPVCGQPPCPGFEVMVSDGINATLLPATSVTLSPDGSQVILLAQSTSPNLYPVGSRYAWGAWPIANLYGPGGLPVLPWSQALVIAGPPPPPPPQ